ncbi:MAG TPA: tetratricopeptide repeat protein [Kofleriaceae bacterium]|nr:tetratricopeptide repeat protein [Kofleriaceae bacterium]
MPRARWLAVGVALALVGCRSRPGERRSRELVEALGGDPSTVHTTLARDDHGQPVAVTTFQAQAPAAGALAADQAACDRRDLDACVRLGRAREAQADYAAAERAWRIACDAQDGEACHELGNMFTNPYLKLGREGDGAAFLERGCTLGHGASCYFLGGMVERGDHVAADPARAHALYQRGCDLGHHWACERLRGAAP